MNNVERLGLVKFAQTVSRKRLFEVIEKLKNAHEPSSPDGTINFDKDETGNQNYYAEFDKKEHAEEFMKKFLPKDWERYAQGEEPLTLKSADFLPKPGEGSHRLFYPGSGFSEDVPEKDIPKVYGRGNTLKKRLSSSLKGFAVGGPIAALITALATRSSSRPYGDIADTARFGLKGGVLAGLGNLAYDEYKDHRDYEKSLSKSAFNTKQKGFMSGFGQTPRRYSDSRYAQSAAEDNRRSEQIAAKHRQQSEARKNKPQKYSMPAYAKGPAKNPAANVGGNMAAALDPAFSGPAPWQAGYKNPNTAKIQQAEAQSKQVMSNFNNQFNQSANRNSIGVAPRKPQNNTLAFNVNGAGNFSSNR